MIEAKGRLVFISGMVARQLDGTMAGIGDIEVQTRQVCENLKAAVEVVSRETKQTKFHFVCESSGALRAGAYAMAAPDRVNRLVFAAFTYKGEGSPTLTKRAEQVDYYRSHNMRKRDRDMIRSIATRDKPGTSDPAAVEALADAEMVFGDQIQIGRAHV